MGATDTSHGMPKVLAGIDTPGVPSPNSSPFSTMKRIVLRDKTELSILTIFLRGMKTAFPESGISPR